eukprot:5522979-Prymnesium_polylepis.1
MVLTNRLRARRAPRARQVHTAHPARALPAQVCRTPTLDLQPIFRSLIGCAVPLAPPPPPALSAHRLRAGPSASLTCGRLRVAPGLVRSCRRGARPRVGPEERRARPSHRRLAAPRH